MDNNTVTIPAAAYVKLIATEERLRLLEKAIRNVSYNPQIEDIKQVFDIGVETDE